MLKFFERKDVEIQLEKLKHEVVDDLLDCIARERNDINEMEKTLGGSKRILSAIEILQEYLSVCDKIERRRNINK